MAELVLKGGRVIDATGSRVADVVVGDDGRIAAVGPDLDGAFVLDASGCVVAPGLVDLHTHLRQPGREEAETVESGSRAAALGGYTAVVAMPNTEPAIDCAAVVREVLDLGAKAGLCDVRVAGAITVGRAGEQLAPMAEMAELGVRLFTDDGGGVQDAALMRRALEYAADLGVILAQHCEDETLAAGGHMHEGEWSSRLGIAGQPAEAEELMVMRDIALARLTGARGPLPAPLDGRIDRDGPRGHGERRARHRRGDDAPLHADPRRVRVVRPGVQGEPAAAHRRRRRGRAGGPRRRRRRRDRHRPCAAFPGSQGAAVRPGAARACSASRPPSRWRSPSSTCRSRRCSRCCRGSRRRSPGSGARTAARSPPGYAANLCVIDPTAEWIVDPAAMASRSRNTPYAGRKLTGTGAPHDPRG